MSEKSPHIETIAIGDELLTGKIADTNSAFVGNELFQMGFRLTRETVVADDFQAMEAILKECAVRSQYAIVFGGLGPTSDDKTAECIGKILDCRIVEHAPSKERLLEFYRQRNRSLNVHSLKQVLYPEAATPIPNLKGMAPGFQVKIQNCLFYFLPGVPLEMKAMFTESVLPHLHQSCGSKDRLLSHSWKLLGIAESDLQVAMDPIEATLPAEIGWLGYRTKFPENHLSLYLRNDTDLFEKFRGKIDEVLRPWCYTQENKELEEIVLAKLGERKQRIALAESCTGGLTVQRLTRIAGASENVWGGFVSYQVDAKARMLGVQLATPEQAVSQECTRELAENAKRLSGCDYGAAVTGFLGPTGGTATDPIGTIYLCVVGTQVLESRIVQYSRTRELGQWGAATHLLNLIRQSLES